MWVASMPGMAKNPTKVLADTLRDRLVGPITRLQDEDAAAEYVAWLAPEGTATDDGRLMAPDSLTWREPPLPLMASDRTLPGHLNAVLVGNLVDLDRAERDGVTWVTARVRWDSTEEAQRFRELVDCALDDGDGCAQMRGVSVDLAIMEADVRYEDEMADDEEAEDPDWPGGVWLRVRAGTILGATLVPMPAFSEAHVEPITAAATRFGDLPLSERDRVWDSDAARRRVLGDGDWDRFERAHFWVDRDAIEERGEPTQADFKLPFADLIDGELVAVWNGVTAATAAVRGARGGVDIPDDDRPGVEMHQCRYYAKARDQYDDDTIVCPHEEEEASLVAAYPVAPPSSWFSHDGITGPTPLTVSDGRVFGHAALRDTCHTGLAGCTTMPEAADLGMFLTGHVVTQEGTEVAVGQITLAGGHPSDFDGRGRLRSIDAVQRAYADTRSAVADVTAGYDEWGLWVAGALRPGVTDEEVRVLRASPLSGHWRWRDGGDHLIALVAVNAQGFPVRRLAASAVVADGLVQARRTVGPMPLAAAEPEVTPDLTEAVWALVADLRQALTIVNTELSRFRARARLDAALSDL